MPNAPLANATRRAVVDVSPMPCGPAVIEAGAGWRLFLGKKRRCLSIAGKKT
jgi:hypothetical protein